MNHTEPTRVEWRMDTHVHVYPSASAEVLIRAALTHLARDARTPDPVYGLLLTETASCDFFKRLREGTHGLPPAFEVVPGTEPEAVSVRVDGGMLPPVWIFSGQQIVTNERLEVLALALADRIPDGLPIGRTLAQVREAGGVPVLAWAPGKWFGARGRVVREVLEGSMSGTIGLGDSSLRPLGWGEPLLMRAARRRGFTVLAGSDPLPFPGEEYRAGCYAVCAEAAFDATRPVSSVREALRTAPWQRTGCRNDPFTLFYRMAQHHRSKKRT